MLRACCLSAPINPNTLNTFAKCRYQLKLLARWYVSSGNWANSMDDRALLVSVAIATTRVIVRDRESPILWLCRRGTVRG